MNELVDHCMAVRPISEGGEAGPIFCGREKGHDGEHRNMMFEWPNVSDAQNEDAGARESGL